MTFDTFFGHYDILSKTRSRMTRAITFSRQNDVGSHARTTQYWENLVVVLILESNKSSLISRNQLNREPAIVTLGTFRQFRNLVYVETTKSCFDFRSRRFLKLFFPVLSSRNPYKQTHYHFMWCIEEYRFVFSEATRDIFIAISHLYVYPVNT